MHASRPRARTGQPARLFQAVKVVTERSGILGRATRGAPSVEFHVRLASIAATRTINDFATEIDDDATDVLRGGNEPVNDDLPRISEQRCPIAPSSRDERSIEAWRGRERSGCIPGQAQRPKHNPDD